MRRLFLIFLLIAGYAVPASAQGLLWSLPPDGTLIRYAGDYQQTDLQVGTGNENVVSTWSRELTIKSVGRVEETINGKPTPCRWIEFKLIDGKKNPDLIPGPAGARLYKVLIPEDAVTGRIYNENQIHNAMIPIVRGYRQLGPRDVEELTSGVLQVYPTLTLLMHYQSMTSEGMSDPESSAAVSAEKFTAQETIGNRTTKVENTATLWRNDDVPFGLVKWTVKQSRYTKAELESVDDFVKISEINVTMTAQSPEDGAQSDLPDSI
jgi:hypothetical protein